MRFSILTALFLALNAAGQGYSVRSYQGSSTNQSHHGTMTLYNGSGVSIGGIGVYTNTLTATPIVLPVGVNCGFIIRSPVGVDIQTFAQ